MNIAKNIISSKLATYLASFFTTASTWVGELLKSSVGDLTLEPTGRWCFKGDSTGYLALNGIIDEGTNVNASISITLNNRVYGREELICRGNFDWFIDTNSDLLRLLIVSTVEGNVVAQASFNQYKDDKNHVISVQIVDNQNNTSSYEVSIDGELLMSGTMNGVVQTNSTEWFIGIRGGLNAIQSDGYVNDVKVYNHHFPLDNFKPASTPSVVEYPDKIGGAKATLVNGAPALNLSARTDVSRSNNLLGFRKVSEEYYSPAQAGSDTLDVDGLPLTNPPINNGLGYNGCEQTYRFSSAPQELIDIDVDNLFFDLDGLPKNFNPYDITNNDYIRIEKQDPESVSKMEVYDPLYRPYKESALYDKDGVLIPNVIVKTYT